MTIESYSVWTPVEYPPSKPGRYLVAQRNNENRKYRWIRYWTGEEWSNTKLDIYGEVYSWAELPPYPSFD